MWMMSIEYHNKDKKHVERSGRLVEGAIDYSGFRTAVERAADELYMQAERLGSDATLVIAWVHPQGNHEPKGS
jgi:hypothetical protein